jgi:predicted enzyme related to lactoylglutathione lyase
MPVVNTPYAPGTPCWVDLAAPDLQAAIDFYRELFGWQGEVGPEELGGYAMMMLNGQPVAGIFPAIAENGNPAPPTAWNTYIATTDADGAAARAAAAGGKVLSEPLTVAPLGRMFITADPSGAVIGGWQPQDFHGAAVVNEPGALVWNELNTGDLGPATTGFYQEAFGMGIAPMEGAPEGMGDYYAVKAGDRMVGGARGLDGRPEGTPPHWAVYFAVEDTDATVAAAVQAGATVLVPPMDIPTGRLAGLADPQGAVFWVLKE